MDTKKKVKQSLPYSIAISVLNMVISLFGMIYLVRYLTDIEYGILGLFMGLPFLINIGLAFGYDKYITRFIPSIKEDKEVARIFWRIIMIRLLLMAGVAIILVSTFSLFAHFNKDLPIYQDHFNIYMISMLSTFGNIYVQVLLNARFLQKQILFLRIIYQLIRVAIIMWGIHHQLDFYFFVSSFAVMDILNLFLGFIIIAVKIGPPRLSTLFKKIEEDAEEKEYRLISYVNELGTSFLGTDIDRYILNAFSDTTQIAIYVLSTQVLGKLTQFFPRKMFKPLATPAFFSEFDNSKENVEKLNRMFQFLFNANNIVGFFMISCFLPVGDQLLTLFFHKPYTEMAYLPISLFLFFMILYSVPVGMVTQAIKKPKILLISKVSILLNLGLGIPLAKFYGAAGMAFATAMSLFIKNMIIYILVRRHVDVRIPWKALSRSLINSGVAIGVMTFLHPHLNAHVLIDASLTGFIYLMMIKLNPIFSEDQRKAFYKLLPKKVHPIAEIIF